MGDHLGIILRNAKLYQIEISAICVQWVGVFGSGYKLCQLWPASRLRYDNCTPYSTQLHYFESVAWQAWSH